MCALGRPSLEILTGPQPLSEIHLILSPLLPVQKLKTEPKALPLLGKRLLYH